MYLLVGVVLTKPTDRLIEVGKREAREGDEYGRDVEILYEADGVAIFSRGNGFAVINGRRGNSGEIWTATSRKEIKLKASYPGEYVDSGKLSGVKQLLYNGGDFNGLLNPNNMFGKFADPSAAPGYEERQAELLRIMKEAGINPN